MNISGIKIKRLHITWYDLWKRKFGLEVALCYSKGNRKIVFIDWFKK